MKLIKDLDIDKIEERHLISLEKGSIFYRRTHSDPLAFRYNNTTFTTAVPLEKQGFYLTHHPTGAVYATTRVHTVFKETENYIGDCRLYEIILRCKIERILNLNKVCAEQGIEPEYLRPDGSFETEEQQMKFEAELYNFYGMKLKDKNIYGVQFRSRKDSEGDCLVFYDNLPHIPKIKNNFIGIYEKSLVRLLYLFKIFPSIYKKLQRLLQKLMFQLNGYTLREYVSCKEMTDDIVRFNGKNRELLDKIRELKLFV